MSPRGTLFVNGTIITMDDATPSPAAVGVVGECIVAVGDEASVRAAIGSPGEIVDLRGRTLLPAFIDSHAHLATYGVGNLGVDCKAEGVRGIVDLKDAIRRRAAVMPPGTWIRARGYDHSRLAEQRHPNRWDLDDAAPNHPVHLVRTCGHIGVANSLALAVAGVRDDAPDPTGGSFERVGGRITGLLFESAQGPIYAAGLPSETEFDQGLDICERDWLAAGVGSVVDCGGRPGHVQAWQRRKHEGRMGMRVTFHVVNGLGRSQGDTFVESEVATDFGDDWLRVGGYKVMVDGSSSGPTAGTREPYTSQPGFSGQVLPSQDQLNAMFEAAHRRGFQLTMHGVGDRAVEMGLTAMERAFELAGPPRRRPRIEHCAMVPDDLMPRLKRIGLIPIPQPYFIFEFGDGYLRNYGEGRGGAMFPIGSFLRAGILVAAGSDSPVSALQPLKGIQAAAQRFTQDGQTCGAEERINAAQCLPLYTINGAHAVGMGDRLGSISTGKLADLTVLAADPRAVAVDELAAIPVDITMVGGVIRHVR